MKTGIYIRAKVGNQWGSYDIGDPTLPDIEVVKWMNSRKETPLYIERLVLCLLGRDQDSVTLV